MARTKKVEPADEVKKAEHSEVEAWASPGTRTAQGYVPKRTPRIEWITCEEFDPELGDLKAGIDIGVAMRVFEGVDVPGKDALERRQRRLSVLVPRFEGWAMLDDITMQPLPCPDPADPETYRTLAHPLSSLYSLGQWLQLQGITKALVQSTSFLSKASTKVESSTPSENVT